MHHDKECKYNKSNANNVQVYFAGTTEEEQALFAEYEANAAESESETKSETSDEEKDEDSSSVEMSPQKLSARKIRNSCSASVKIPACQSRRRSRNHIWVPVSAQESVYSGTLQESGSSCNWQLRR
ncbi:hypothetical protein RhiLY_07682 [Ceratobasidium sp. AG-Ba]|nr:hypothetical protein RhiLY_07682 [Ceratobasidium sp. AG-Ba]